MASSSDKGTRYACILGIGLANPPIILPQDTFPDNYFNLTDCNHMVDLKNKLRLACEKCMVHKRYSSLATDVVKANSNLRVYGAPSQDLRQEMLDAEIPPLALKAANKAIEDWGRPVSDITHVIFCNNGGSSIPGPDYDLVRLLGLPPWTSRFMLYSQGCIGGGAVIRLAKDIAENNPGARLLLVCCDLTTISGFRGPSEANVDNLVAQALFGDGASAVVVGADVQPGVERAIFEVVWTRQRIIDDSHGVVLSKISEAGFYTSMHPSVTLLIGRCIEKLVEEAKAQNGIGGLDRNDMFWVVHPNGSLILDQVEKRLGLKEGKLEASREVLREYGNMSCPTIGFVMETMRRKSEERGLGTAGQGHEWGMLMGFGPGVTSEIILLRCPKP